MLFQNNVRSYIVRAYSLHTPDGINTQTSLNHLRLLYQFCASLACKYMRMYLFLQVRSLESVYFVQNCRISLYFSKAKPCMWYFANAHFHLYLFKSYSPEPNSVAFLKCIESGPLLLVTRFY